MKINLSQCCPLFSGISENEMDKLLSCLDARERRYQKGELVISAGTKISRFGVLLSGTVEIQQEDFQEILPLSHRLPQDSFLQRPLWVPALLYRWLFCPRSLPLFYGWIIISCYPHANMLALFHAAVIKKYGENPSK